MRSKKLLLLSIFLGSGLSSILLSDSYEIIEQKNTVSAFYEGQKLWTYRHDPIEGKPYFHPLSSIDGTNFTDLRPKDHLWHRGLWFSWKFINGLNYWEENKTTGQSEGETRILRFQCRRSKANVVQFHLDIEYGPNRSKEVVMRELRRVVISPPDQKGIYTIDWSATFTALNEDVILDRTPIEGQPGGQSWGGYSGWSVRMNKSVQGGVFVNSHGAEDADRQPAKWMLYKSPQQGSLLLMDHSENLNYPSKWYLHDGMPFFSPAVIHDAPYTLQHGQPLTLRYRLVVAPNIANGLDAEKAWNEWINNSIYLTK